MECCSCSMVLYLLVGMISVLYFYFRKKFSYWKDRGVSYIEPKIPFGNLPFCKTEHLKTIVQKFYDQKDDNPFIGAYFFTKPVVIATDLDFVRDVLIKDFSNFHGRGMYINEKADPLTANMLSVEGPKWRSLRSKLTPTFTSGKIKFMHSTVVEVSERFNHALGGIVQPEKVLEMRELLARFTTDIIGTCAFGIECNSLNDPNAEFRKYGRKFFEEPTAGIVGRLIMIQWPKLAKFLNLRLTQPDVSEFFMRTVRETIEFREKNNVRRNDFMDLLIQLKNNDGLEGERPDDFDKLTIDDIAAQSFLFFVAGFETSSATMMYSLYELALNPDIQEKARQEINRVLLKHNGELTYEAVKEITYVNQIISEALRKYPPAVTLLRKSYNDYHVSNSDLIIEKGTSVFIPAYAIQHDPEIYPEPEKFDPDRFSSEQIKCRPPMTFLSFGDGPRSCIGMRFGRLQSRVGLIMLLKNYRFKPCQKTRIPIIFSKKSQFLSPESGMFLQVEKCK